MAGRRRAAAGAIVVLGWLAGCGDSASPPAPSPAGEAVVTRIDIEGPTEIAPGTETQFVLLARLSDGSARDVTGQAELSMATGCAECSDALTLRDGGIVRTPGRRGPAVGDLRPAGARQGPHRRPGRHLSADGHHQQLRGRWREGRRRACRRTLGRRSDHDDDERLRRYRLYGASGGTTLSVVKNGYQPLQEVVDVKAHQTVDFQLHPVTKRSGETYTLTIRAASDCALVGAEGALPAEARERRYGAMLSTTVDNRVFARLSGARFATVSPLSGGMGGDGFTGAVEPKGFGFSIVGWEATTTTIILIRIWSSRFGLVVPGGVGRG